MKMGPNHTPVNFYTFPAVLKIPPFIHLSLSKAFTTYFLVHII